MVRNVKSIFSLCDSQQQKHDTRRYSLSWLEVKSKLKYIEREAESSPPPRAASSTSGSSSSRLRVLGVVLSDQCRLRHDAAFLLRERVTATRVRLRHDRRGPRSDLAHSDAFVLAAGATGHTKHVLQQVSFLGQAAKMAKRPKRGVGGDGQIMKVSFMKRFAQQILTGFFNCVFVFETITWSQGIKCTCCKSIRTN